MSRLTFIMRRDKLHGKVLRDFPGRDVCINYTTYYWVDGAHACIDIRGLIALGFTKAEVVKRFNHRIHVALNDY